MLNFKLKFSNIKALGDMALLFGVLIIALISRPIAFVDDAWISFRYAYNLAYNGELVFNVGERVEGITNLLWTLILAIQAALIGFDIKLFAIIFSIFLIFFICFRLWQLGPIIGSTNSSGTIAGLLLILTPEFLGTTTTGLESPLFAALLVELVFRYVRNQFTAAFTIAGFLFMTRPEGIAVGFLLIGLIFAEYRSLVKTIPGIVIACLIIASVTTFRFFYYGVPIPNSVIAKSAPILDVLKLLRYSFEIYNYFLKFILANFHLILILICSVFYLFKERSFRTKPYYAICFCALSILLSALIVLKNGGDWMPNHRLLLQYGPFFVVPLIPMMKRVIPNYIGWGFVIYLLIQTLLTGFARDKPILVDCFRPEKAFWGEVVTRLGPVLSKDDIVSAEAIGYIGYNLEKNYIHDPMGLTEPYIARHGQMAIPYGKKDVLYTVGTIRPAIMVWHWTGHIQGLPQSLLDNYESFCYQRCDSWKANVVMIRRDRAADLAPAFHDWQKVKIETEQIRIE